MNNMYTCNFSVEADIRNSSQAPPVFRGSSRSDLQIIITIIILIVIMIMIVIIILITQIMMIHI